MKKTILLSGMVVAALGFQFARLDASRRRFLMHLLRQVPYLPGRYYA